MKKLNLFVLLLLSIISLEAQSFESGDLIHDPYEIDEVDTPFNFTVQDQNIATENNFFTVSKLTIIDTDVDVEFSYTFGDTSLYSYTVVQNAIKVNSGYLVSVYYEGIESSDTKFVFEKLLPNGELDTDYEEQKIITSLDFSLNSISQDSEGNVYVLIQKDAGQGTVNESILRKYSHTTYLLDSTYNNGTGEIEFNVSTSGINNSAILLIDSKDRIVISQGHEISSNLLPHVRNWNCTIRRYTVDGVPDTSFNNSGHRLFSPQSGGYSQRVNLSINRELEDGRYLVAGTISNPLNVVILLENGLNDPHFNKGEIFNTTYTSFYAFSSYFIDSEERLVLTRCDIGFKSVEGSTQAIPIAKTPSIHRYIVDTSEYIKPDTSFGNSGSVSFVGYEEERASQWTLITQDESSNKNYILTAGGLRYLLVASKDQILSSIFDASKENQKSIFFPNPASTQVFTEKGEVEIYSLDGILLLATISDGVVDVSSLEKGSYVLKVGAQSQKLLIN